VPKPYRSSRAPVCASRALIELARLARAGEALDAADVDITTVNLSFAADVIHLADFIDLSPVAHDDDRGLGQGPLRAGLPPTELR
jgi:hypothetical protein